MENPSVTDASVQDDMTWVEQTITVDAIDPAKNAIEANPGWRFLHAGMGSGGQTTLTYGWPWPGGFSSPDVTAPYQKEE